ncbi:MAG: hypothetical protein NW201_00175 [Gemmatimonadales bacterium]|nr:hypothetical protein [Gemmatimonadales bacterium]
MSQPALSAVARLLAEAQAPIVREWSERLGDRLTGSPAVRREQVLRQLDLMVRALGEMLGPLRGEVKPVWLQLLEHYGRSAARRGLSAGEVVDELQHLRELLVLHLAPAVGQLRARLGLAVLLRLNRALDVGLSTAVAGYTDALVASLFAHGGIPGGGAGDDGPHLDRQLDDLERSLAAATGRA